MKYGANYVEDLELAAAGPDRPAIAIRLRLIGPDDKAKLQDGLLHLSEESQYLRFFTSKVRFTSAELAYLTELDGHDHFAIGVGTIEPDGSEGGGIGLARFVRLPGEPTVAEPAIAVVDDMQHRGIGSLLMRRLAEAAKERGIEVFRCEFLSSNAPVRELLAAVGPEIANEHDGAVVTAEFALGPDTRIARRPSDASEPADADAQDPVSPLLRMLALVAHRGLELERRFEMLLHPDELRQAWETVRDKLR